jgi:hypothetical protein
VIELVIRGTELPGRRDPHVALQVGREPVGAVPGDAPAATWTTQLRLVAAADGTPDVRGPAVQGRKGERFVYLTWGEVPSAGAFVMVRRAKLMLASLLEAAPLARAVATVKLTDERGRPRAARVPVSDVRWEFT